MTITKSIAAGFGVSLLILLMVGLVSLGSTERLIESTAAVQRTQRVQSALESLLQSVTNSESGARGYALTGESDFLEPYTESVTRLESQFWDVRQLMANDPGQLGRVDTLDALVKERLATAADLIAARDSAGLDGVAGHPALELGRAQTEAIRVVVDEMKAVEAGRLGAIQSRARGAAGFTRLIIVFGSLVAIGVVSMFGALTRQQIRERERAQVDRDLHFNSSLDMLCIAGFDGYFRQLNPAWTKTLGWSNEELLARPWLDFVHPDDVEKTVEAGSHITEGNELPSFENRYRCKDGTYRWISWNSVPLTERGLIYCVARDITEQRRSRKQFESLFESSPNGLLLVDESRTIILLNDEAGRQFGYDTQDLLGQPVEILVPDRIRKRHPGYVKGYWASPTRRPMGAVDNLFGRRKDGTEFPVHIALTPIESDTGTQVLAAIVDLTERKKVEDGVKRLNHTLTVQSQELETSNRELEAFSYSISHDLRAPLRAIDGFSRVLTDRYATNLPPDAQRYLKLVRDNTVQMGRLIDDLLLFSRLSRQPVHRQPLAPASQVQDVIDELREGFGDRHIEIKVDELAPHEGDPALMRLVWENLLSNAIKYTRNKARATIEVGCKSNGNGSPVYFVRDNGAGFDMRYSNKLFGVFHRLHRAEEYEGTGVGLATVQRIIQRHGGSIWADSEVEKGTTFSFTVEGKADHD